MTCLNGGAKTRPGDCFCSCPPGFGGVACGLRVASARAQVVLEGISLPDYWTKLSAPILAMIAQRIRIAADTVELDSLENAAPPPSLPDAPGPGDVLNSLAPLGTGDSLRHQHPSRHADALQRGDGPARRPGRGLKAADEITLSLRFRASSPEQALRVAIAFRDDVLDGLLGAALAAAGYGTGARLVQAPLAFNAS
eukprot:CAMPEP_0113662832 /NCGR_PEP_ID=MMETSP0038_2-20120614/798_1 /TAXON_ID=2898 /ORGANISM="Cryptomonas paramecium" /LENGTH=195 /DNA_ID=CAMNT_0000577777 /DNA_START=67 /DNA_END=651 /DNA_ORIENTATION=+ /assembly_acc=CAM_ASM_000170